MERLGSHWTNFHEIWYLSIFRKPFQKIEVSLSSDKSQGTLHGDRCTFVIICRSVLRIRNIWGKCCSENRNTHFMFNAPFFFFENRAVYEIMRKNVVEPDRPQMTIWRMRIACWMTKATNTHSEYEILIAFPLQQWLHSRVSMLRFTYADYPVLFE
jgi:hypothetical protein